VLVIDDGSGKKPDDTAASAKAIAHRGSPGAGLSPGERWPTPAGAANPRDSAARAYVCMLESDDLWLHDYLAQKRSGLGSGPGGLRVHRAWESNASSGRFLKDTAMARQTRPPKRFAHEQFVAELISDSFTTP